MTKKDDHYSIGLSFNWGDDNIYLGVRTAVMEELVVPYDTVANLPLTTRAACCALGLLLLADGRS